MASLQSFITEVGPVLSLGLCALGIPLILLLGRRPNLREAVSLTVAILNFGVVLSLWAAHEIGTAVVYPLFAIAPGLEISFWVDDLGLIFALTASCLWILNTLYSIGYMRAHHEHKQTRFYACFAAAIAAAMGAAFSRNLFSLFVFYEVLTLVTYPLVVHAETPVAKAGAKRYLTYLLGLSIAFQIPALVLVRYYGGTFDFHPEGLLRATTASAGAIGVVFVLYLIGVAKAAIMPFHGWLPAAMVAPTPVSALLHAVAVVKAGVFTVSRVVLHVFGWDLLRKFGLNDILVVAACVTIVTASLIALTQDNLKKRLAYSTVSQLSYVLLGVGMLYASGTTGGLTHIAMHAAAKITLFFCAGAIMVALHKTEVSQLDGVGRRMPYTMAAFSVGALAMIGLPPASGIVTKFFLEGGAGSGQLGWIHAVLIASTMLNAAYFLPIIWRAFWKSSPPGESGFCEAPWPCVVALTITALLTIALFFRPDVILELARGVVSMATGGAS